MTFSPRFLSHVVAVASLGAALFSGCLGQSKCDPSKGDADCIGSSTCNPTSKVCEKALSCNADEDCPNHLHCNSISKECYGNCYSPLDNGPSSYGCARGSQCNADLTCSPITSCTVGTDSTCNGYVCDASTQTCKAPVTCTSDAECGNYHCSLGTCDASCSSNYDCSRNNQCNSNSRVCSPQTTCDPTGYSDCNGPYCDAVTNTCTASTACTTDSQCPDNFACYVSGGFCRRNCSVNSDCQSGKTCSYTDHRCS